MIITILVLLGLVFGSFVNALVYRVHEQSKQRKGRGAKAASGKKQVNLSVIKGRSVCVHCRHELAWYDLIPVLSWLTLRGRCRYCHKSISWQYPAVEVLTAVLFVLSYVFWPEMDAAALDARIVVNFAVWLVMLVGFVALIVYDLRWMLLPNRIMYPLIVLAGLLALYNIAAALDSLVALRDTGLAVLVAGGLFWAVFTVSQGKWIGGGDVKLGLLAGLLLADPFKAFLMLLLASLGGTLVILPGLLLGRLSRSSRIPFGPFLIMAIIVAMLFGSRIIDWYKDLLVV